MRAKYEAKVIHIHILFTLKFILHGLSCALNFLEGTLMQDF